MKNLLKQIDERLEEERLSYHRLSDTGRGLQIAKQMILDCMRKDNTINQEIAETMCDHYCKFPEAYDDEDRMHVEKCEECPLNELVK